MGLFSPKKYGRHSTSAGRRVAASSSSAERAVPPMRVWNHLIRLPLVAMQPLGSQWPGTGCASR